ncbi:hypothetical protein [Mycobacterium lepromatosis]|uniref:hypothetical protein n=1 Tax=Mycobacterium lepromatosis TaxID=480418 RepID=UPI00138DEC83|nr:hypothetical protein [Mycobacterium lepromatosis]
MLSVVFLSSLDSTQASTRGGRQATRPISGVIADLVCSFSVFTLTVSALLLGLHLPAGHQLIRPALGDVGA